MNEAVLYIIATPIGNLADISTRALETMGQVDLIAAEDTRHSKKLMQHYNISTTLVALHGDNEKKVTQKLISDMQAGKSIALISDAGTPLISDPGRLLLEEAHRHTLTVVPIPGPCAAIAALSVSGFSADQFDFQGFLPTKAGEREKRLRELENAPRTLIFYEAPHRILQFMGEIVTVFGDEREVVIARELTKQFETVKRGHASDIKAWMEADANQQKGEFVVLIKGNDSAKSVDITEIEHTLKALLPELPLKQAVKLTAEITGAKKNAVYDTALELSSN